MKKYLFLTIFISLLLSCSNNSIVKGDYNLTLNANGGYFNDGLTVKEIAKVSKIENSSSLETPTKSNTSKITYSFLGWFLGNSTSAEEVIFPYTLNQNTTFFAKYKESSSETFTLTLNANGGKFNDGNEITTIKNINNINANEIINYTPNYENHIFLGWYFSLDDSSKEVTFPYALKKDITFYSKWGEGDGYEVNISPEGGTFSDGTKENKILSKQYKIDYDSLDQPSKKDEEGNNYIFVGYSKSKEEINICKDSEILKENISLYAIYKNGSLDEFVIYPSEGGNYSQEGNVYSLLNGGTYTLMGSLKDGQLKVNENITEEVIIIFSNASLTSSTLSPLLISSTEKVTLKAEKDTQNYIYDNRQYEIESNGGAIYALSDLDFVGKGELHVESTYYNGIESEKDIDIKNLTLYVKGINHGIKGKNSLTISSGNISVVSISGDGLKTSDNGLTQKGKQKGDITITGGNIDIDSYYDGLDAAHDINIENGIDDEGNVTTPTIDIKTNKYADTGGEPISKDILYIRSTIDYRTYKNINVYSYNSSDDYQIDIANYKGTEEIEDKDKGPGPGPGPEPRKITYYVWTLSRPQNFKNIKLFIGESVSTYTYYTEEKTYNSSYNMITLSNSYSSKKLSFSWGVHDDTSGVSAKGIKAENVLNINNGTINIKSLDNALHAKATSIIESTSDYGLGTININDGLINIYTDDKGIHADNYLYINNGTINVENSYEGYEASSVNIKGGINHIYASDDGINAGSKDSKITNKEINIYNGFVDIQTGDGDTDGIDSNGTYTQEGGIVISRASDNNQMSTALDTDGQSKILNSGVFIAVGVEPEAAKERRLSYDSYEQKSISFTRNSTHTINNTYNFVVLMSYSKIHLYLGPNGEKPTIN